MPDFCVPMSRGARVAPLRVVGDDDRAELALVQIASISKPAMLRALAGAASRRGMDLEHVEAIGAVCPGPSPVERLLREAGRLDARDLAELLDGLADLLDLM